MVYRALCQSVICYCISVWGGAVKTYLITLERAQRAILKVAFGLPFLTHTPIVYRTAEVLTVRQLFILQSILTFHSKNSIVHSGRSRRTRTCIRLNNFYKTKFAQRFQMYSGNFLYIKLNSTLNLVHLNRYECKKSVTRHLQNLSYDDTESLLAKLS